MSARRPTRPNQLVQMDVQIETRRTGPSAGVPVPLLSLTDLYDGKRLVVELDQGRIDRLIAGLQHVRPSAPVRPLGEMLG